MQCQDTLLGTPKHILLLQQLTALMACVIKRKRICECSALMCLPETPGVRQSGQHFGNYLQWLGFDSYYKKQK